MKKTALILCFGLIVATGCVSKKAYKSGIQEARESVRTLCQIEREGWESGYRAEIQHLLNSNALMVQRLNLFNQIDGSGRLRPLRSDAEVDGSESWQK